MSRVLTAGTFDLLHVGHVTLFAECRRIAGKRGALIVSVNSSDFVSQFKSSPPVQSTAERIQMVASIRNVDEVLINGLADLRPIIEQAAPDFLVIGSDWAQPRPDGTTYHDQIGASREWLADRHITLLYLDRWSVHSSTELKDRIRVA